jgi:hypothetical protein
VISVAMSARNERRWGKRGRLLLASSSATVSLLAAASPAHATVAWTIHTLATPTTFSVNDTQRCEGVEPVTKCDTYHVLIVNSGDQPSSGPITLTDTLPVGIVTRQTPSGSSEAGEWACTEGSGNPKVTCTLEGSVAVGGHAPSLELSVTSPTSAAPTTLEDDVRVEGGGASSPASQVKQVAANSPSPSFGVTEFAMSAKAADGTAEPRAGAHPWQLTTDLALSSIFSPPGAGNYPFVPVENTKAIVINLPPGLVGDAEHTPHCSEVQLHTRTCPLDSRVGTFVLSDAESAGVFRGTGDFCCTAVYNITPPNGIPAEFGFWLSNIEVYLTARVAYSSTGYHVRIVSGDIPALIGLLGTSITFFGNPTALDEGGEGSPFLTNPSSCTEPPLDATVETSSWERPQTMVHADTPVYEHLSECDRLKYEPSGSFAPLSPPDGGVQADTTSAYELNLAVPQSESFDEPATPPTKSVTVTLPEGVALSPAAASGLVGCGRSGPEGIDLPEGDRKANEAGEGEELRPDGLSQLTGGHCPAASQLGEVLAETPLLPPGTLRGHLFLAQPLCGGSSENECTEASATNGELYSVYAELTGDGVVVKLSGHVTANPSTGQLTVTFSNLPQFPVTHVTVRTEGGPHAPLSNPQGCGLFTSHVDLTPWSSPETSDALISPSFAIGGCVSPTPFAPGFSAGTANPGASAFTPFSFMLSRGDREQDLGSISLTMPPGVAGMISRVQLCGTTQASAGTCNESSRIGTAHVTVGSGPAPLLLEGPVYLTGPYRGAPFGLSVVIPAKAGPFNLGDVVVHSKVEVDPHTAQVSVISDPLPQSRDGVPIRLKTVQVTVDRPEFIFNPTNCNQLHAIGGATGVLPDGSPGSTVSLSTPFATAGCKSLPFKPGFSTSTQAKTSKANGASLYVKLTQRPGEANIHKVDLQLPLALPSRLTTLQKACGEAQFNANPAGCPAGSVIGTATAHTPVLQMPLSGPAYLVSHGGAAFPDVEFVLQANERGGDVEIVLDGKTQIKKGVTYSHFETVPDAPISSFETNLPEGPHSALAANGNLCTQNLVMPTTLVGQNGAQVTRSTKITVTGCKPVTISNRKLSGRSVVLSFFLTAKGTVTVTGKGLARYRKTLSAGSHQIKVSLSKAGLSMRRHHRTIKIKVALKSGAKVSSAATTLKL